MLVLTFRLDVSIVGPSITPALYNVFSCAVSMSSFSVNLDKSDINCPLKEAPSKLDVGSAVNNFNNTADRSVIIAKYKPICVNGLVGSIARALMLLISTLSNIPLSYNNFNTLSSVNLFPI